MELILLSNEPSVRTEYINNPDTIGLCDIRSGDLALKLQKISGIDSSCLNGSDDSAMQSFSWNCASRPRTI